MTEVCKWTQAYTYGQSLRSTWFWAQQFCLSLHPNYLAHVPTCKKLDRIIAKQAEKISLLSFFRFEIGNFP